MAYASIAEFRDYMEQVPEYGQQRVTIDGAPSGGTFTLVYEGSVTTPLAYNATATQVQTALRAISAIGSTGVNVSGKPGGPYTARFQGTLSTDAALLSAASSLTGGTAPGVTVAAALDARIQRVLDRATAIIDSVLGVSFPLASSPTPQIVYGDGTDYLLPPPFVAGSITSVTAPSGYTVPEYVVGSSGALIVTRDGVIGPLYGNASLAGRSYGLIGGWLPGVPYTVTATFGYAETPDDIKEACLEIAVDLYRFRDAGSIKVLGVEGAGAITGKGLPETARLILEQCLYRLTMPGVW